MKRAPLRRNTELERGGPLRASTRLKRSRWKRKPKGDSAELRKSRPIVLERARGQCEARTPLCTGRVEHVHHKLLRSQGKDDRPQSLLAVCAYCHDFIHDHPALSYEHGWLIHGWERPPGQNGT